MTEYDPNRWNLWPAVQPPTDVLMRLEIAEDFDRGGPVHRYAAFFDGKEFRFYKPPFCQISIPRYSLTRFRPWNDPGEKTTILTALSK